MDHVCRSLDFAFVMQYILNDKEVQVKTELWLKQNAEYLQEQKGQSLHLHHHQQQVAHTCVPVTSHDITTLHLIKEHFTVPHMNI